MEYSNAWLTDIQEAMTRIYHVMEANDRVGIYDSNRKRERFFSGLLNCIYDFDFVVANPLDKRYASVDLIGRNTDIAVVIAYDCTYQKVKAKLTKFYTDKLNQEFRTLVFLSSKWKANIEVSPIVSDEVHGETDVVYWNSDTLLDAICTLPSTGLEEVHRYLGENHMETMEGPTHRLPGSPPQCDHFVHGSRDRELAEMRKLLKLRRPIFVWGMGGIGKTQTVIQLAKESAPPMGAYQIDCPTRLDEGKEFLREAILAANFATYRFRGTDNANRDQEYHERLEMLRREYQGAMLIIDNLDCSTKTLEDILQEQAYRDLAALDLQLVFTTRSPVKDRSNIEIGPLSVPHLLQMLKKIIKTQNYSENELLRLIRAVNGHTLTVSFFGHILEKSWGMVEIEDILTALEDNSLRHEDFPEVFSDQNQRYLRADIYTHLKTLFSLSSLNLNEQRILQYATLLGKSGMDYGLFRRCLPASLHMVLDSLIDRGMIQKHYSNIGLHPVIRELCQRELAPTDTDCSKFLLGLWKQIDPEKSTPAQELEQITRCFCAAADILPDQLGRWASFAGQTLHLLGRPHKALHYNLKMLYHLERNPEANRMDIAAANTQVGNSYLILGDYQKALDYQKEALNLKLEQAEYEPISERNKLRLANSYNNIGIIHAELENFQEALKNHQMALEIAKAQNDDARAPLDLAKFYTNTGLTYHSLHQFEKALECHEEALELFEKHLPPNHSDLASSYNYAGAAYDALKNHQQALSYKLKALAIFEKVLPIEHPELARAYNSISSTYNALGVPEKALDYAQRALAIRETVLPPDHPDLAVSYNGVASIYSAMGDYANAQNYALNALCIREKCLPAHHPHLALSYKNLGYLCFRLGDNQQAIKYVDKALTIMERPEYANHPYLKSTRQLREEICDSTQ